MGYSKRIKVGAGFGVPTLGALFLILASLGAVFESEDIVCDGVQCSTEFSVKNPTYKSWYIYNPDETYLLFDENVRDVQLYVKYYGKWRPMNFTRETRLPNVPKDRVYNFVFPRYSTKHFLLNFTAEDGDRIKWTFGFPQQELDPLAVAWTEWTDISSVKNETVARYKYVETTTEYPEVCSYSKINETTQCNPAYNETIVTKEFDRFETVVSEPIRIGLKVGGDYYDDPVRVVGDELTQWDVPIGDRNFEEFGTCRPYEVEKGVCKKINLLEAYR